MWVLFNPREPAGRDPFFGHPLSRSRLGPQAFEGLAILATNRRANFNLAYVRRLRNIVELPRPEPGKRRQMWHGHLAGDRRRDLAIHIDVMIAPCG